MKKYRKKPIVIEAHQTDVALDIETLEGIMHASVGDYIIIGVNGEQYPCKPDIFKKTYEEISETFDDVVTRQSACEYCHEDSDGSIEPIEKNCRAFIHFGMNGWEIILSAKGWNGSAKIMYCPMCGRRLKNDKR